MTFSFQKPTPQLIKNVRDTLIGFLSGCLAFANLFASKLGMTGEDYAMWIGFIIIALKAGAKFFGVSEDEAVKNAVKANELVVDIVKTKEEKKDI